MFLGRFETQEEAAKAYLDAAKHYRKEFAYSNFSLESENEPSTNGEPTDEATE